MATVGGLQDAAALVTGGTSGIGLGIVRRLLAEGARVTFTGRDAELGRDVERSLGDPRRARFTVADAADEDAVGDSVDFTLRAMGRLDLLVNNAGIALTETLIDTPVRDFDRLMAINLRGGFLYARACFPALADARGSIVHVGSDAGLRGEQPIGAYSVSKAAVVMMSKMLALDGAPRGVRSNCVCPGATVPGMRHVGPASDPDRGDSSADWPLPPLARHGTAADVASAVVFLAGPDAAFISGAVLLVDGAGGAGVPVA